MIDPIVFGKPEWDESVIEAVSSCIRSGWWGAGALCEKVEQELCRLTGAAHCVMVGSGTAALHSALVASKIGPGEEVITSPITYAATVQAIEMVGATPVFADIDPETGNLDPSAVLAAVGPDTAAILPVHLAGRPCDMAAIMAIAEMKGLIVLEDAAHAIGASVFGRHAGRYGFAGAFSFNYSKNVCSPEGGAIITDSWYTANAVRSFAHCGEEQTSWERFKGKGNMRIVSQGTNYRPTDISAAMILPQFGRLGELMSGRAKVWEKYNDLLKDTSLIPGLKLPAGIPEGMTHAMHLYQVRLPEDLDRGIFRQAMRAHGVGTGIHYSALHLEPYYRKKHGSFKNAEEFGRTTVSIPLSSKFTNAQIEHVAWAVKSALRSAAI